MRPSHRPWLAEEASQGEGQERRLFLRISLSSHLPNLAVLLFLWLLTVGHVAERQALTLEALRHVLESQPRDVVVIDGSEAGDLALLATATTRPRTGRLVGTVPGLKASAHVAWAPDPAGALQATYALAAAWGVWFSPDGDVVPSAIRGQLQSKPECRRWGVIRAWRELTRRCPPFCPVLPLTNLTAATPAFETRGLQPFHDFASGPDWWSEQDYKVRRPGGTFCLLSLLGPFSWIIPPMASM